MNEQIRALLLKKHEKQENEKRMVLEDVNQDLIIALLAVPIYGKDARDEDILSIIINSGTMTLQTALSKIKEEFADWIYADPKRRDKDGFIHLKPR